MKGSVFKESYRDAIEVIFLFLDKISEQVYFI